MLLGVRTLVVAYVHKRIQFYSEYEQKRIEVLLLLLLSVPTVYQCLRMLQCYMCIHTCMHCILLYINSFINAITVLPCFTEKRFTSQLTYSCSHLFYIFTRLRIAQVAETVGTRSTN